MLKKFRYLLAMALGLGAPALVSAADVMKFNVQGGNPGGAGGYTGTVELHKLGKDNAKVRWTTGRNNEVTEGIAVRSGEAMGAAYGKDLYAVALYTIKRARIETVWATAADPAQVSSYNLEGSDFNGELKFSDGSAGTVTFTPGSGGVYKVVWNLPTGKFEGVGVRRGNALAAASGAPGGSFGVAVYGPKGDVIEGSWSMMSGKAPGTEVWTLPSGQGSSPTGSAPSAADGASVTFAGETYLLKEKKSAPGQATSELREYLREGETFEGYRKMVALYSYNLQQDAATVARSVLNEVQKKHPGSYVKELTMEAENASMFFILVNGNDVELNLWHYVRTAKGLVGAQFVLRNKEPYETQKKFKAEQDKNYDQWVADIKTLASQAQALIAASSGTSIPASPAASAPKPQQTGMSDAELAKAIQADFDRCGKLAQKFMTLLSAGDVEQAVSVMSDSAFTTTTRAAFIKAIEESNKVFGPMKSFKPDRESKDFAMKDGLLTFTLEADSEYANAKVLEVLRFIRNAAGDIEFIGYARTAK